DGRQAVGGDEDGVGEIGKVPDDQHEHHDREHDDDRGQREDGIEVDRDAGAGGAIGAVNAPGGDEQQQRGAEVENAVGIQVEAEDGPEAAGEDQVGQERHDGDDEEEGRGGGGEPAKSGARRHHRVVAARIGDGLVAFGAATGFVESAQEIAAGAAGEVVGH